jgi:hypothetical protein
MPDADLPPDVQLHHRALDLADDLDDFTEEVAGPWPSAVVRLRRASSSLRANVRREQEDGDSRPSARVR